MAKVLATQGFEKAIVQGFRDAVKWVRDYPADQLPQDMVDHLINIYNDPKSNHWIRTTLSTALPWLPLAVKVFQSAKSFFNKKAGKTSQVPPQT